jgi:hypothetical protein
VELPTKGQYGIKTSEVGPTEYLSVGRIIRPTSRTKNRQIADLTFLSLHQDDTTFSASEINCAVAGVENRRGADKAVSPRPGDGLEAQLNGRGHGILECSMQTGQLISSSSAAIRISNQADCQWDASGADDGGRWPGGRFTTHFFRS